MRLSMFRGVRPSVFAPGESEKSEVTPQCRIAPPVFSDRWMKFIKHVTVNTSSGAKTLQRINKCWLYQPLLPAIYTLELTFLLDMNYFNELLLLL